MVVDGPRRAGLHGSVMLAVWVWACVGAAQDVGPTVFEVEGACAGAPKGSGFLVRGLPGIPGPALVTALHVVHRCGVLHFHRSRCDDTDKASARPAPAFSRTEADEMIVWRELDLVAFPLGPHELKNDYRSAQLQANTPEVKARVRLMVEGVTALNACAEGEGMARYTTRVEQLVAHVLRRTTYSREDVVGTLADPVRLLVSWSTAQSGVSGGPVLEAKSQRLLAMNTGGDPQGRSAWAVLLGVDALTRCTPNHTHVGVSISDAARPSLLTQVDSDDFARHEQSVEERPAGGALAASGALLSDLGGTRDAVAGLLVIEAYGRVLDWHAYLLGASLGLHAAILGAYGRYAQTFGGTLTLDKPSERYREDFLGLGLEAGPELRVLQQSWPRLALSAFVRVMSNTYAHPPENVDATELAVSLGVRLKACFNVSKLVGVCIDPALIAANAMGTAYGLSQRGRVDPTRQWLPGFSVGLGFEYAL